jgi:cytochrome P450
MSMIGSNRLRLSPRLDSSVSLVARRGVHRPGGNDTRRHRARRRLVGRVLSGHAVMAALPALLAVAVGAAVVAWTGRPFFAVLSGMPAFWLATALIPA